MKDQTVFNLWIFFSYQRTKSSTVLSLYYFDMVSRSSAQIFAFYSSYSFSFSGDDNVRWENIARWRPVWSNSRVILHCRALFQVKIFVLTLTNDCCCWSWLSGGTGSGFAILDQSSTVVDGGTINWFLMIYRSMGKLSVCRSMYHPARSKCFFGLIFSIMITSPAGEQPLNIIGPLEYRRNKVFVCTRSSWLSWLTDVIVVLVIIRFRYNCLLKTQTTGWKAKWNDTSNYSSVAFI